MALELELIAERTGESPRRIRARIEKEGMGQSLATQILERKTYERILEYSGIEDLVLPAEEPGGGVETVDSAIAAPVADSSLGASATQESAKAGGS
jgi:trigger factor